MSDNGRIIEQAAAWHAASARDDMDWDGFTEWLEADPRHRTAYDEVALADALVDEHRADLLAAEETEETGEVVPLRRAAFGWRGWAGVAIAASLVAVLSLPQLLHSAPDIYQTGDTAQQIALEDGSSVLLAPHSRLSIDGRHQERMALAGGAWFDIRHDPSRPLEIAAGDMRISDIGTQFDVQADHGQVRVEVADGEVKVAGQALAQPIRLAQGRSLLFDSGRGTVMVSPVKAEDIGEWRAGRLSFDSAPLTLVVADLARYAGVNVTLSDALRDRRFSGSLVIGDGETALRDLSQLMDLELVRGPDGYRVEQRR
ncbi:MAG: FecR domain-containing protein [Novosphingobium sp.]|nr:FecR domain-containing protein [Novosphingobium sp.]